MDIPIFKTEKPTSATKVTVFADRLEHSSRQNPFIPSSIPLDKIDQVALLPKPPGSDPRQIDLALRVPSLGVPVILSNLDFQEATRIQETIKQQKLQEKETVKQTHPFTLAERVLQKTKPRQTPKTFRQSGKSTALPPKLSFRKAFLGLFLAVSLLGGKIEVGEVAPEESFLLLNLPKVYILPSSPLYSLKMVWEDLQLILASSEEERSRLLFSLAEKRLSETVLTLTQNGEARQILEKYQMQFQQALGALNLVTDEQSFNEILNLLEKHRLTRKIFNEFLRKKGLSNLASDLGLELETQRVLGEIRLRTID